MMRLLATAGALLMASGAASADVVLLDEYWSPEIVNHDTQVTEIDTLETGDATEAKFGECSAQLENAGQWPSVRFRNGAVVKLTDIPAEESDAVLWYRTDTWAGKWRLEIWAYIYSVTRDRPVKVLEATLDGGDEDGRLIADDAWHEARGVLLKADEYDQIPPNMPTLTYIWLRPEDGWDIPHRTYIDRIEIDVLTDETPPPEPARRVRPDPGAQSVGPGWIWWEGEDAMEHTLPSGGTYLPHNVKEQATLSNGAWLQHEGAGGCTAKWHVDVADAGRYNLWCRRFSYPASFKWRINNGPWAVLDADTLPAEVDRVRQMGTWTLAAGWTRLGQVDLEAGKQTFEIEVAEGIQPTALDCFLLSRGEFEPDGPKKPGEE